MKTWKDENALRSRKSCQYLLRCLKFQYLDPVLKRVSSHDGTRVSYAEITDAMDTIRNEFYRQAYGASDVRADEFRKFNQVKKWLIQTKDILLIQTEKKSNYNLAGNTFGLSVDSVCVCF